MLRPEVVDRLMDAATQGMANEVQAEKVSYNEIFSAYMTLALRAVVYFREKGADVAAMRSAVEQIYAALPQDRVN